MSSVQDHDTDTTPTWAFSKNGFDFARVAVQDLADRFGGDTAVPDTAGPITSRLFPESVLVSGTQDRSLLELSGQHVIRDDLPWGLECEVITIMDEQNVTSVSGTGGIGVIGSTDTDPHVSIRMPLRLVLLPRATTENIPMGNHSANDSIIGRSLIICQLNDQGPQFFQGKITGTSNPSITTSSSLPGPVDPRHPFDGLASLLTEQEGVNVEVLTFQIIPASEQDPHSPELLSSNEATTSLQIAYMRGHRFQSDDGRTLLLAGGLEMPMFNHHEHKMERAYIGRDTLVIRSAVCWRQCG